MKKIFIIKSSYDIDKEELIPVYISSSFKVCSSSDSDTEEEKNIDTNYLESIDSDMLVRLSSSVCNIWQKIQIHINTHFSVTGCILCVIPHISNDSKYHSYSDHRKQVKIFIKTLFHGFTEDEMAVTQDIFWTEYTDFDNNNGSFAGDEFIWNLKDIRYGNSHLWHQKYSLPCTRVLGFAAFRVTSKVLVVGAAYLS